MLKEGQKVIMDSKNFFGGTPHRLNGHTCRIMSVIVVLPIHGPKWEKYDCVYTVEWRAEDNPGRLDLSLSSFGVWTEEDFHVVPHVRITTILASSALPDV